MKKRTLDAPCKINLTLNILGRRDDGYHDLRMVMQTVSLCDTVTAEDGQGFALHPIGEFFPREGKTLEQRAAEAFFAALGQPVPGLSVTLEKRTPAYAGLGGGSADVAALLRILRAVHCTKLPLAALECIGLQVGSDVPFCLRGGTALAEGRGERLTDLPPLPDCSIVLCKPDFDVPTGAMFTMADGCAFSRRPDVDGMLAALEAGDLPGVAARLYNVFEEVLPAVRRVEIEAIKNTMCTRGALNASMSGSGPAVFGLFRTEGAAREAADALKASYRQVFLAKPVRKFE